MPAFHTGFLAAEQFNHAYRNSNSNSKKSNSNSNEPQNPSYPRDDTTISQLSSIDPTHEHDSQILRTSRWAITAFKLDATKNASTPISTKRRADVMASLVCKVDKTMLIAFDIKEASAKIRIGMPYSEESEDTKLPIWSGVIPIPANRLTPIPDQFSQEIPLPNHLKQKRWNPLYYQMN